MTREEAIHCLSVHSSTNGSGLCTDEQHYEAKQMAIQALEQEPCDVFDKYGNYKYPSDVELTEPNTATSMPCEDAIGRQAAIEIARSNIHYGLDKEYEYARELLQKTMAEINSLPPVNPQQWETCFDCPLSHGCPKIKGCTNEQAIEYASEMPNDCPLSAQPERKTGHWVSEAIQGEIGGQIVKAFICSECGAISVFRMTGGEIVNGDLCPNCGAKMIKPQESEK